MVYIVSMNMTCKVALKPLKNSNLEHEVRELSKAIVNDQRWYRAVLNHVKDCNICHPNDIVVAYCKTRGGSSRGFINLAKRYQKLGLKKGKPVSEELIKDIILKSKSLEDIVLHEGIFSYKEIIYNILNHNGSGPAFLKNMNLSWFKDVGKGDKGEKTINAYYVIQEFGEKVNDMSEEEIIKAIEYCSVMHS